MLLNLIIAATVCLLFVALTLWKSSGDDLDELMKDQFSRDFEYTKNAIRFVSELECDRLIDNFESRWIGRVKQSELHYFIGKLIEAQCLRMVN